MKRAPAVSARGVSPRSSSGSSGATSTRSVVMELERRGELWRPTNGVVGLRGDALALFRHIEARVATLARAWAPDEWLVPPAIGLGTLARAGYFASFPQWLTLASHLTDDENTLEAVATADDPAWAARHAVAPAAEALPPAVCFHAYDVFANRILREPRLVTMQGTCWRHEGEGTASLERGWAFTMREIVCLGTEQDVAAFCSLGTRVAESLATELGLRSAVAEATDPFFAPTARGKELLQRMKALKHELLLPVGEGRTLAAASFNHHQAFFGDAFGIRLADGRPASSGCVAFGLERWLLAYLVVHGTDPRGWPLGASDARPPVHLVNEAPVTR